MFEAILSVSLWLKAIIVFFLIFILICFAVIRYQDNLIYVPAIGSQLRRSMAENPIGYRSPAERGLAHSDVWLSVDGELLHGWFVCAGEANGGARANDRPTVVFFHENAGNIGLRLGFFEAYIAALHCNILVVAYRGFGLSHGKPSERNLKADALCILDFVATKQSLFDPLKVTLHGRSLGGAVLLWALARSPHRALFPRVIIESTFTSLADVVDNLLPLFARLPLLRRLLLRSVWDSAAAVAELGAAPRALFIVGAEDRLTPPWMTRRLFELLPAAAKALEVLPEATHNEVWQCAPERYFARVGELIAASGD